MSLHMGAQEAMAVSSKNPHRAWIGNGQATASWRLAAGSYFAAGHRPRFQMNKGNCVFTIGSCFAREIEFALMPLGVKLALQGKGVERKYFASWQEDDDAPGASQIYAGVFNKYTTASIAHDVRRTILDEHYENEGLIELDTDRWFDPHSSGLKLLRKEIALANRARVATGMAMIRTADVVVITLGQTEGWLDEATGLAMNGHPGPLWLRKYSNRFSFIEHSFRESLEQIEATIALIREHCNPDMKFVLTVSPIPFAATFRPQDVMVAHTATKAKLRTIADEVSAAHDFVDYFPSFEMVTNTPRDLAWEDDQLHVRRKMVDHIMRIFVAAYYPGETLVAAGHA